MKLLSKLLSKKEPKTESEPMEKIRSEKKGQLIAPKCFRRNKNAHLPLVLRGVRKNNNGIFKGSKGFTIGFKMWDDRAIFFPRNKKLKGYQKQTTRRKKAA